VHQGKNLLNLVRGKISKSLLLVHVLQRSQDCVYSVVVRAIAFIIRVDEGICESSSNMVMAGEWKWFFVWWSARYEYDIRELA
jgi:hypothetical protein